MRRALSLNTRTIQKLFGKYASSKRTAKEGIAELRKPDGELTQNKMEKLQNLTIFTSVFTQKGGNIPNYIPFTPNISEPMADLVITEENVVSKLSK